MRNLSGFVFLQMMGGRFRSVMPSNLVYPGACAIESLPAPGSEYASHAAKGELRRLFARSAPHLPDVCAEPFCLHCPHKKDRLGRGRVMLNRVKIVSCACCASSGYMSPE